MTATTKKEVQISIDFGTSNTAVAVNDGDNTWILGGEEGKMKSFPTTLFFGEKGILVGDEAQAASVNPEMRGRTLRWIKRVLGRENIKKIRIDRLYTLEQLVSYVLIHVRETLESHGFSVKKVYAGAPVYSENTRSKAVAMKRLKKAFALAGFSNVVFVEEPKAALWYYRKRIKGDKKILLIDMGAGTTDVVYAQSINGQLNYLASKGNLLAGRAYDEVVQDKAIFPLLGKGITYQVMDENEKVPKFVYDNLLDSINPFKSKAPMHLSRVQSAVRFSKGENKKRFENLLCASEGAQQYQLSLEAEGLKIRVSNGGVSKEIGILRHPMVASLSYDDFTSYTKRITEKNLLLVDKVLAGDVPEVIILTGGMAKHRFLTDVMNKKFPDAEIFVENTNAIGLGLAQWQE